MGHAKHTLLEKQAKGRSLTTNVPGTAESSSPQLGVLLAGVLCSQPCSTFSRVLQERAPQQLKLLHLLHSPDVHHSINLPSAGKRDPQMTI